MPSYSAPVEDTLFLLNDVLGYQNYSHLPRFSEATPDVVEAILKEGAKFCEERMQPLNQSGDQEGCRRHEDGTVTTPKGFKELYDAFGEAGWGSLAIPEQYGGQNLPASLAVILNEYMCSSNMAFAMYPGLTQGAIAALLEHASDELKDRYVPKMTTGEWSGTMNLTEPHCGTDLGMLRTKAVPQPDGSYKITGTKIFISAGEHDLSENIIHLVLARIEGAPAGTKGISLFLVPKKRLDENDNPAEDNGVSCGSIEEKMGIHGNATCVMNYDDATGWLVGEENKGLRAMFVMMNEARLGVAIQGVSQSEVAYQNAVAYAKDRIQGRSLTGPKAPDKAADPIIVHPDVRRVLMTIRAFNEAARALYIYTAIKGDVSHVSSDEAERQAADDFMGLLTPVLKGVFTDKGFDYAVMAQQMFGGHGYITEWGMEQFVRDARIAMIYEGANGIQALDLVGRKLPANGGRAIQAFFKEVGGFLKENSDNEELKGFTKPLKKGLDDLQGATMWLMQNGMANPDNAGAASTDYMHMFGLVAMGYMWGKIAVVAQQKLADGAGDQEEMLKNKLTLGTFYMERLMPETGAQLARLSTGAATMMSLAEEAF
ncbi:acyl-CoA dehydrogenase C-terminal domain-containing protein [Pseudovibrio exalbescens]|uniref:acyl-CoA dehydrogenase C-terminal domain-containing protein n=1 Tax=Pseudovibrio exalbescens TaxID=197461 RepID=UPI0023660E74|nr:acyl-CoA dehydrogenase C-terminal domain-containing protein [Pseudovibrio exalbescens]MDD7911128.1 acyl-CoA dehydrogenase C-terminal domain-containing protein [Pseudovibrio exalbescens]